MAAGWADLLSHLGIWLGGRKATGPVVPVEPGCIEMSISAASIGLAMTASSMALSVREATIGIEVFACD